MGPTPVAGVFQLLKQIQQIARDTKNSKAECAEVAELCEQYADVFAKHVEDIKGTGLQEPVNDAQKTLAEAKAKVEVYSTWTFWRTIWYRETLEADLKKSKNAIQVAKDKYLIAASVSACKDRCARAGDMLLCTELAQVMALRLDQSLAELTPDEAKQLVELLEKMLDVLASSDNGKDAKQHIGSAMIDRAEFNVIVKHIDQALKEVRSWTGVHHEYKVLTGHIKLKQPLPIPSDSHYTEVYRGWYANTQEVALRRFVLRLDASKAVFRLQKEVTIWSRLVHPNILPFIGIIDVEIGRQMIPALVSPWQENGNIVNYTQYHVDYNRFNLLAGAAAGLDYLHSQGYAHGNVKGSNILVRAVTEKVEAVVADFHMAKIMQDDLTKDQSVANTTTRDTAHNWMAPELFAPPEVHEEPTAEGTEVMKSVEVTSTEKFKAQEVKPTAKSDVWSLGMVILEVLTGMEPFQKRIQIGSETRIKKVNPSTIPGLVAQGITPERPVGNYWITDPVWEHLKHQCWQKKPELRSDMATVHKRLLELAAAHDVAHPPQVQLVTV
ncbi:serine/threonine protein kinase-like protein [Phanerochaete sordida]|uniref:Serine/threonine protein kinase-like protein n=1 Tax=Phanerochaete sordida TaxID=48140 RepID=A0A9P3G0I2_9APHY|nr:serine/threonine protein kinase-like protein [Phanerochaete sordida]